MAYAIRYKPAARRQLDQCREDYPTFAATVEAWLRGVATAAERQDEAISFELADLLELAASGAESSDAWALSLRNWLDASAKDKLKALVATLRKRCPPWQFRGSVAPLPFLDYSTCEVHAYYLVDHVEQRIIIALFKGLPGQ